jgi:hypothetical protein
MASEELGSPQNVQYFLAILQGYNARIKAAEDSAATLLEEKKRLEEKLTRLKKDNTSSMEKINSQQRLISCQEEHISLLENIRSKSNGPRPWSGQESRKNSFTGWKDPFPSAESPEYHLFNNPHDETGLSFTGQVHSGSPGT